MICGKVIVLHPDFVLRNNLKINMVGFLIVKLKTFKFEKDELNMGGKK